MPNDEEQPSGPPIVAGCRVCAEPTLGTLTVCPVCEIKVWTRMGSADDWHVREYIRLMKLIADAPAPKVPAATKSMFPTWSKNLPCVCGRLYSREIAVDACVARDHKLPKEPDYA